VPPLGPRTNALLDHTAIELRRFLAGGGDLARVERTVRSTLLSFDPAVPLEVRDIFEGFARDLQVARHTMQGDERTLQAYELATSVLRRLKRFGR
jgi:hypothetical protein